MTLRRFGRLCGAALLALVLGSAAAPSGAAGPDALWNIAHGKCVPNEAEHGEPGPCALVDLDGGYVILKDLIGDTQYLLIPTAKITGIEDPALLAPGTPNYFAAAWRQRHFTADAAERAVPRSAISLAINSVFGRSQNQLHIHIDCVRPDVREALGRHLAVLGDTWAPFPEPLLGHRYRALVLAGTLDGFDPFKRLADGVPGARTAMASHSIAVVGASLPGGAPGFVVLAGQADLPRGDRGAGEELQDHSCALARQ